MILNLIKTKRLQNLERSMSTCEPHAILMVHPSSSINFKTNWKQTRERDTVKSILSQGGEVSCFCCWIVKIIKQLFILGLHWLDVRPRAKTPTSCCCLSTHFWLQMQIQHPGTRKINKYIFTILHCCVPDFKYVRFVWHGNHWVYLKI